MLGDGDETKIPKVAKPKLEKVKKDEPLELVEPIQLAMDMMKAVLLEATDASKYAYAIEPFELSSDIVRQLHAHALKMHKHHKQVHQIVHKDKATTAEAYEDIFDEVTTDREWYKLRQGVAKDMYDRFCPKTKKKSKDGT